MAQWWRICLPMQETWVPSLRWEDPLEKEMATHSSILAWEIPRTVEPGGLQSMGSQGIWHDLAIKQQKYTVLIDQQYNVNVTELMENIWRLGSNCKTLSISFSLHISFTCLTASSWRYFSVHSLLRVKHKLQIMLSLETVACKDSGLCKGVRWAFSLSASHLLK